MVLPLHGRGNRGGQGKGVNVTAYIPPADPSVGNWKTAIINNELHKTHNFDSVEAGRNRAASVFSPDNVVVAALTCETKTTSGSGIVQIVHPILTDVVASV